MSLAIVLAAAIVVPVGHRQAAPVAAFFPTIATATIVAFALTASLLHERFRTERSASAAILTLAYASAAGLQIAGAFDARTPSAAWLDVGWHVLFCWLVVLACAIDHPRLRPLRGTLLRSALAAVSVTLIGAPFLALLAHTDPPVIVGTSGLLVSLGAAGTVLLGVRRLRERRDVWLAVVLLGIAVETLTVAFASAGSSSYGWYFSRAELAVSAIAMLMMLQSEYGFVMLRVKRANRELEARNDQMEAFIHLQDDVAAALPSRAAVIEVILAFAQRNFAADGCAFEVPSAQMMRCEAACGILEPLVGVPFERDGSLVGMCANLGEVLVSNNAIHDPRVNNAACETLGITSIMAIPIAGPGTVEAVVTVCSTRSNAFGPSEARALQLVAKNLTSALLATKEFATLQASEQRYRALTDAMPQLVGVIDPALRVLFANERFRRYAGDSINVHDDAAILGIVHPDDRPRLVSGSRAIDFDTEFESEVRLLRVDGCYRWHSLRAVALSNADAAAPRWIFTATDVEDRKLAETIIAESAARVARAAQSDRAVATGLREANRLLVMAEEMAHVGHYRLDLVNDAVFWSDEVYRTYGLPSSAKPNLELIVNACHPDDRSTIVGVIARTLEDGSPFTFNARILQPDGTIRAVAASGQVERGADGTITGLFGILQDITPIKDAERERERLSERVVLATTAGKIGIWEWNLSTDRLEWDGSMFALHGLTERVPEPTYDRWMELIAVSDRDRVRAEVKRAIAGAPLDTEFRVVLPSGAVRHLRAMGSLLHNTDGVGLRMVGANWDITEMHRLADDLREEKERAEQASHAKSDFLARMSHEIRTPMNGIIGFTTLVLDGELSAEQRRYVMLLRDAGRSLLAIINDILDFSKLEAGRIDLENIPVNISALIDGALSIVRTEALPKGIALRVDIARGVPAWVSGDPTRLRQTLLNLLTNAVKFTQGGTVTVRVECDVSSGDHLRFTVSDTGIGIPADQYHLLFDDFSQLERSTTRQYGGTGLGLAICKRLARAMDGTIGVESQVGVGSRFWFTARLPQVDPPEPSAADDVPEGSAPRHILVVDDNRVNKIVVAALLERDGHAVTLVENGAEAVDAVTSGRFDLVLMDMQMPVMDGVAATRAIRALPGPERDIPIVAVTANAMAEEVERCHAAGMNGHLAKPIDRQLLRRAIARWTAHCTTEPVVEATLDAHQLPAAETLAPPTFADTSTLGIATLLDIFDGDHTSVMDVFAAALTSIEIDRERIVRFAGAGDLTLAAEAAHRMKGTSASIRSLHILSISTSIQDAAKHATAGIDPALLGQLDAAVEDLRRDLDTYRRIIATSAGVTQPSAGY